MTEGRRMPHMRDIFGAKDAGGGGGGHLENKKEEPEEVIVPATRKKGQEEAKHLERHLSMKKTIRKKIMRELQQAFVEHPEELTGSAQPNDLSITYGKGNFLDFLRSGETEPPAKESSGNQNQDKQGFWRRFAFRRNKR